MTEDKRKTENDAAGGAEERTDERKEARKKKSRAGSYLRKRFQNDEVTDEERAQDLFRR